MSNQSFDLVVAATFQLLPSDYKIKNGHNQKRVSCAPMKVTKARVLDAKTNLGLVYLGGNQVALKCRPVLQACCGKLKEQIFFTFQLVVANMLATFMLYHCSS